MMKNIWIITHYYPPEPGAPQARLSEMAQVWKKSGHSVTVLTCFPNHPNGIIPDFYQNKLFFKETMSGIKVLRHWVYATPNKGFIKKIINHLSFMISSIVLSLFRGEKPDVILVSSPTFFSVISAYLFSRIRKAPLVFEVRDLWPGIFIELGVLKNKFIIKILEKIEIFLYKKSQKIVTVTEGFKSNISQRNIPIDKIHVITNGVDLNRFYPDKKNIELKRQMNLQENSFVILYAGAHGLSHGLDSVLKAAEQLKETHPEIQFLFVGEGAKKNELIELKNSKNLENVIFKESVEKKLMKDLYCISDICLVPLKNIEGFQSFIPSKMFEILACEKVIIASLKGEAASILNQSKGAYVIPPEDPEALKNHIIKLYTDPDLMKKMKGHARQFVETHYNREQLALKYLNEVFEFESN